MSERVGWIHAASWVIWMLGKVPLMLNDKTGLGAASLASEMTSFSGGQDNAKPHSVHTTARLRDKRVWLLNWSVCRLESSLSCSTFTLARGNKINPKPRESCHIAYKFAVLVHLWLFFFPSRDQSFFKNVHACLCSCVSALGHVLIWWSWWWPKPLWKVGTQGRGAHMIQIMTLGVWDG